MLGKLDEALWFDGITHHSLTNSSAGKDLIMQVHSPVIVSALQTDRRVSLVHGGGLSGSAPHLSAIGEKNCTEKPAVSPH